MKTQQSYGLSNDLNLKTLVVFTKSFLSVRRQEVKTIQAAGMTLSQFAVLEILYHKGNMRISDIIERTLSTGGNMTVVIANLEKEGYISRVKDPNDGRASQITITEKGRQIMADVFPGHAANISNIFNVLSDSEKQTLMQLLKKLSGVED